MENGEKITQRAGKYVKICTFVFFGILLLSGLLSFRDVGISWDEKTQYVIGRETYRTVFDGAPVSQNEGRRFHGPTFEFLLYGLQKILPLHTTQQVFAMRHLVGFLLFFLGTIVFYALARHHFRSPLLGLLGAMMLGLSPRIYGHAFFNTRDVPTLVLFIVAMFTLVLLVEKRSIPRTLLHAGACALLLSLRMVGILLPFLTLVFLALTARREKAVRDLRLSCGYLVAFIVFTIALWPLLWTHPLHNFLAAYQNMSNKSAGGFYFGQQWSTTPWHWIPVWIAISTPIVYTALFLIGSLSVIHSWMKKPVSFAKEKWRTVLFFLWFFLPIATVFGLRAGIFDEWRHVYFIYPAFLLLALEGVCLLWQTLSQTARFRLVLQAGFTGILALNFLCVALWMVRNHPLEYVYFSLPPPVIGRSFELDYWGLSFRQGVEYILRTDSSPIIPIALTGSSGYSVINVLAPEDRSRIVFSNGSGAKYILDNFRSSQYQEKFPASDKVHSVFVGGREVLAVYRNTHWNPESVKNVTPLPADKMVFFFSSDFFDPKDIGAANVSGDTVVVYFKI